MAEAKVVANLAEVCASGAEVYSAWTTAKAVVKRRYLATKTQGKFEDCAELLVSLTRVLRTYLRIDLARELLQDVLFPVMEHFAAEMAAGAAVTGLEDCPAARSSFDAAAEEFLQRVFDTLAGATSCTYSLTGSLPLTVGWNAGTDGSGVDPAAAQQQDAAPWVEDVVLEFSIRASFFLSQRPHMKESLFRWSQNLYFTYEQLLVLRQAHPSSNSPAPSPPLPAPMLAAQLLRMSVFSEVSKNRVENRAGVFTLRSPVSAAVYWLTHFSQQPNAVNHLFARYVYFDILSRGLQRSSTAANPQNKGVLSATLPHGGLGSALERVCSLKPRDAILMARAAVETYRQAFPHFLKQKFGCVTEIGGKDSSVDPAYAHLYKWTWFLDSLTLILVYSSVCRDTAGRCSDGMRLAEAQQRVCAQVLKLYTAVAAELPELNWKELLATYIHL